MKNMADKHDERTYPLTGLQAIERDTRPHGQTLPSIIKETAIGLTDTFFSRKIHSQENENKG